MIEWFLDWLIDLLIDSLIDGKGYKVIAVWWRSD